MFLKYKKILISKKIIEFIKYYDKLLKNIYYNNNNNSRRIKKIHTFFFGLNSHPFFFACPIIICRLNLSVSAPTPLMSR